VCPWSVNRSVTQGMTTIRPYARQQRTQRTHQPMISESLFTAVCSSFFSFTYAGGMISAPSGPTCRLHERYCR